MCTTTTAVEEYRRLLARLRLRLDALRPALPRAVRKGKE